MMKHRHARLEPLGRLEPLVEATVGLHVGSVESYFFFDVTRCTRPRIKRPRSSCSTLPSKGKALESDLGAEFAGECLVAKP